MVLVHEVTSILWWLILWVNLSRLREAQIASKTLFLGISVCVCLEEIRIKLVDWDKITLTKIGQLHPILWGTEWSKMAEEGEFILSTWAVFSYPWHWLPGSWVFRLKVGLHHWPWTLSSSNLVLNYITSFPGSLACRQQTVWLISLHNYVSQCL